MSNAWTISGTHAVQFYDNEQFIQHAIAEFFTQGARPGDPLILVSRLRTFEAVAAHLSSGRHGSALDVAERVRFFDAEAALPQIMEGDSLDLARAERLLKEILSQSCPSQAHGAVRLYDEVVDIMCHTGRLPAALQFEGLASSLFDQQPQLSILCGYAIERFKDHTNAAELRAVCQKHTHVIPAESFTGLDNRMLAAQPTPRMRTRDGTTPDPTVYVVEDDASLRRALSRLLTSHHWPVRTFESAEAFLAELDTLSSGCLVVDIGLQGISGLKLVHRLRDARLAWPIIMMSGLYDKKTESEALRLGAQAYLRKPFDSRALLNAIARALSR
jgi:CheY-like chemotaxis protein